MVAKAKEAEVSADTVVIDDIGPIEHLEIPCKPGTVVVLTGHNGQGKTTALEAIDAITSRNGSRLENRDGTHKGQASFAGVTIKVGRNGANRRLGDLAVATLEDDLNLDDLVDPGQKDPSAADVRRIKALAKVCGVELPLADLQALVGGPEEFAKIVDATKLQTDDVIGSIEKIKRDFEGAARLSENAAVQHFQNANNKLQENEGIDLDACSDESGLQKQLEDAIKRQSALESQHQQHDEQQRRLHDAEAKLAAAVQKYDGPSAEQAASDLTQKESALLKADQDCKEIEKQLLEAANTRSKIVEQIATAKQTLMVARSHEAALEGWKTTLDTASVPCPAVEELIAAADAVKSARDAANKGVLIREGIRRVSEAKSLEEKAAVARSQAERFRDAAQSTLDVLAGAVSKISRQMSVDSEFRLVVDHPVRGKTYYSDLSAGEKWRLALDIAVEAFARKGVPGVLVIRQEAWEGLDGINQKAIVDHVSKTSLTVYTAQASKTDGEPQPVGFEVLAAAGN